MSSVVAALLALRSRLARRALALAAFVTGAAHADPLRFEAQAGTCQLQPTDQGGWWQGQLVAAEMRADCYQLGVSRARHGLGWRAAWVDLGTYRLREEAFGGPGVQPHWSAIGDGETFGATLGVLAERELWRRLSVTAETGAFLYRSQWRATAFHHASATVANVTPDAAYGVTWYAGAGLSYRLGERAALTLNGRFYPGIRAATLGDNGDNIGPARANAWQLTFGLQLPF